MYDKDDACVYVIMRASMRISMQDDLDDWVGSVCMIHVLRVCMYSYVCPHIHPCKSERICVCMH